MFENSDLVFKQSPDDGMDYYHNYDLVINWLSQRLAVDSNIGYVK